MRTLIIILLNVSLTLAADFSDYFDLRIGNVYIYNCTDWRAIPPNYNCSGNYRLKVTISDTVNYYGKKYCYYTRELKHISGACSFSSFMFPFNTGNANAIRLDSVNGNIYCFNSTSGCYYSPTETMIDSLNSKLNDIVTIRCVPSPYSYTCIDTVDKKKFYVGAGPQGTIRREYVRGMGLVNNYQYQLVSGAQGSDEQTLIGSVINGVVYGDTTFALVGINIISSEIPDKFLLSQNYPNPFNPVTKIRFSIPVDSRLRGNDNVVLTVYDALGREVQILVNENLSAGTYEVDFDGSNLPSGVYFYKLNSGDFAYTKKMVLIK